MASNAQVDSDGMAIPMMTVEDLLSLPAPSLRSWSPLPPALGLLPEAADLAKCPPASEHLILPPIRETLQGSSQQHKMTLTVYLIKLE